MPQAQSVTAGHAATPNAAPLRGYWWRLFWTGEGVNIGRILASGAAVWFAYAILTVLVHGVVMDQDLVPAQVIAGAVRYPPGHPHEIFYSQVFNLPSYVLAGLWRAIPDVIVLSALR